MPDATTSIAPPIMNFLVRNGICPAETRPQSPAESGLGFKSLRRSSTSLILDSSRFSPAQKDRDSNDAQKSFRKGPTPPPLREMKDRPRSSGQPPHADPQVIGTERTLHRAAASPDQRPPGDPRRET